MFARAISLSVLALPLLATAVALPGGEAPASSCSATGGSLNCCNTTQTAPSSLETALLGLLGIVLGPVTGLLGLTCTSIVGGDSCSQQPVCCTGNNFSGGLIVVGCSPVNLNL